MNKAALVIGENALYDHIAHQLLEDGCEVHHYAEWDDCAPLPAGVDEIVLLTDGDDNRQMKVLRCLADRGETHGARVHLMTASPTTLMLCRRSGFCPEISEAFDVHPFSLTDEWSRHIRVDWQPITLASERRAHIVIFGADDRAEQIAVNTALQAHFPNYTRDTKLRTRITVIDDEAHTFAQTFIARYPHLMDHSHYRMVDCTDRQAVTLLHKPMYHGSREDFVDVEWEFVKASATSPVVAEKLILWSTSPSKVLTIAVAKGSSDESLTLALHLPEAVSTHGIPVYVWVSDSSLLQNIATDSSISHLKAIGMNHCGYDIHDQYTEMGKTVNYIYTQCYDDNIAVPTSDSEPKIVVQIDPEVREKLWSKLSMPKRMSNIYNAMTIGTKLRAVGLDLDSADRIHDLSMREIALLAEVEHNRWSVEELILGYRPCTDAEQQEIQQDISKKRMYRDKKVHYDLRSYRDLRTDATGKNVNIYDICLSGSLPLIANYQNPQR